MNMKKKTLLIAVIAVMVVIAIAAAFIITNANKVQVGDQIDFGNYQDEIIRWEVLAVEDGKMLIISDKILDWKLFNDDSASTTWENSSIRAWLNDEFYYTALSSDERARIVETTLENPGNYEFGISGSSETTDKVFLLSSTEIEEYFDREYDRTASLARSAREAAREYATENVSFLGASDYMWWTRTAGNNDTSMTCVGEEGEFIYEYASIDPKFTTGESVVIAVESIYAGAGVRPAMWINIK